MGEMKIFDCQGKRLFLNEDEIAFFLNTAESNFSNKISALAQTLVYTGCTISEALNLTHKSVNITDSLLTIYHRKNRKGMSSRNLPVPLEYLEYLTATFKISTSKYKSKKKLWSWSRQYGHRVIKEIIKESEISNSYNFSPKSIRHAYGVNAIIKDVPLNILQKWLGHADIGTTKVYFDIMTFEDQEQAQKMWPLDLNDDNLF